MKKLLFLVLFISGSVFSQQHQLYYEYSINFQPFGDHYEFFGSISQEGDIFSLDLVDDQGNIPLTTGSVFQNSLPYDIETFFGNISSGQIADLSTVTISAIGNIRDVTLILDEGTAVQTAYIKYYSIDIISLTQPTDNSLCGTIQIDATPGHPINAYNWQFQALTDTWQDVPIQQGQDNLTITLEDLYGANSDSYLNTPVRFRVYNQYGDYFAGPVSYTFIDCSPGLLQDPPETVAPLCSNTDDGSIIVKFDRPLASNERMLIYVENQLPDTTWDLFDTTYILDATDINAGTGNTYTWSPVLAPNKYRLRYVSKYDSTGNIPTNPNSDEMSQEFDIIAPPPVTFTHTKTDVLCKGDNNGTITITASGGTNSGFQYSIDNGTTWQNSNAFTGLSPATYTLLAHDSNNCISETSASVTINEPAFELSLSIVGFSDPSANGASDGSISIDVFGGTGSVSYQWTKDGSDYATTQNLTDLSAGVYRVTATDANGCTAILEQTLQDPLPLNIIFTVGEIDCNGDTANITAQGQGGFIAAGDDYDYLWNTGGTNQTLLNVPAGTYTVTITDSNDVSVTDSYTLIQPDALMANPATTDVLCNGGSDGTVNLNITGGTSPYTISWADDNTITTANRTDLPQGEYVYTITDSKACSVNGSATIGQPNPIVITVDSTQDPTTAGATDGVINITVNGGTANYTFEWTDDQGTIIGTTEDISNLGDGDYTITVTDVNFNSASDNVGCTAAITQRLTEPQPLSTSITESSPISCFGDSDGQLTADPIGGSSNYTYEWFIDNNGTFDPLNITTQSISGLPVGNYRVVVTDDANARAQADYTLGQPIQLALTFTAQQVNCFGGSDGAIDITPMGGTAPYSFTWTNSANTNMGTTEDISDLSSGNYTLSIIDANGCFFQQTIEITAPIEAITITGQTTDPSAATATDGSIDVTVSGGTPDYTFEWTDDTGTIIATTEDLSGVGEGMYTLTVSDSNVSNTTDNSGCISTEDFPLLAPDAIIITITETVSILCNGLNTGELTASVSGGFLNLGSDYSYSWAIDSNGTFESIDQNTAIADNLSVGNYQITVTDDNNVEQSATYQLTEPETINIELTVTNTVSCGSGSDGAISSLITGGTSPYSYLWSNGETTEDLVNIPVGNYTLEITDANGCISSDTIEVTQPGGMSINSTVTPPLCFGSSDASIEVFASGGSPPYTYIWNTGDSTSSISGLAAGNYSVTITDNLGCLSLQNFTVENPELLTLDLGNDIVLCQGQSHEINATISDPDTAYQWTSTNGFTSNSPIVSLVDDGEYTLTLTNPNGCAATDTITITTTNEIISADFLVPTQAFVGETIVVVDVSEPVPDTVTWEFSQGTIIINQNEDYAELKFEQEGVYTVTMITTKGSCKEILTKEIIVQPGTDFGTDQDTNTSFIKEFKLYPNPSNGVFKAEVELQQQAPISIKIINLTSNSVTSTKVMEGQDIYIVDYNINIAIGVYLVILETPKGSQIRKIIVV